MTHLPSAVRRFIRYAAADIPVPTDVEAQVMALGYCPAALRAHFAA